MPRVVSFIVLAAVLLLIGSMFFQVVLQFAVPLFLAGVMVVVFKPLHEWICSKLPDHPRAGAFATTLLILLLVLLPALWLGWNSYLELKGVVQQLGQEQERERLTAVITGRAESLLHRYEEFTGEPLELNKVFEQSSGALGGLVLSGLKAMFGILVGLAIMMLAVYYFFADGPVMLTTVMRLSPLEDRYERELLDRFANVSRAVVLASALSALAQGLLAGAGYFVAFSTGKDDANASATSAADVDQLPSDAAATSDAPAEMGAPVMLLTMVTMVMAIVPFIGSASVWTLVCLALWLVDGRPLAAGILATYCALVVSSIDNLIKPLVLHGQSNLHPLLALISVLGGVEVLGPVGIIVGPMLVAFVQALLVMINRELKNWESGEPNATPAIVAQAEALADAIAPASDDEDAADSGAQTPEEPARPNDADGRSESCSEVAPPGDASKPTRTKSRKRGRRRGKS